MNKYFAIIALTLLLIAIIVMLGCNSEKGIKGYEGLLRVQPAETDKESLYEYDTAYYRQYKILRTAAFEAAVKDIINNGEKGCTWNNTSSQGESFALMPAHNEISVWVCRVMTNDSPTGYIMLLHYVDKFYVCDYSFKGDPSFGNIEETNANEQNIHFIEKNTFAFEQLSEDGTLSYIQFGSDKTFTRAEIRELNKKYVEKLLG